MEHVGGSSKDMGAALSIAAALELPTMALFIYIVRKIPCHTLLKISSFFFFIKALAAYFASSVALVHVSQCFQLLAFALFTPASVYYVNSIIKGKDKIKGQSLLGAATMGIAGTLANITGGKIIDSLGVSHMLLIGSIAALLGSVIVILFTEESL